MSTPNTIQTPEHLKPYETAARIYCTQLGVNPDATRKVPHPLIGGVTVDAVIWHEAAERLADLSLMLSSLKTAHNMQTGVVQ